MASHVRSTFLTSTQHLSVGWTFLIILTGTPTNLVFCFRTEVKLESLEDAVVLEDYADDLLSDKHGCPAYVSPEILRSNTQYSGRAADMWGLGVMLYTMLVGR